MNVPVVRKLALESTKEELDGAVLAFERDRANLLSVEGADANEIMTHLLAAQFVRHRMNDGLDVNAALREYGQRVKAILGGGAFGPRKG